MTNNHAEGYRLGPEARVVLHRHRGAYAVAVVLDEGPYSRAEAEGVADAVREQHGGWVTRKQAAHMLGLSVSMVDNLRTSGRLRYWTDDAGHAMISKTSISEELSRRSSGE